MLRIPFPFRLFKAGERNRTSFEREMIGDISSVLGEIRVQKKEEQRYCCSSESVLYFIETI